MAGVDRTELARPGLGYGLGRGWATGWRWAGARPWARPGLGQEWAGDGPGLGHGLSQGWAGDGPGVGRSWAGDRPGLDWSWAGDRPGLGRSWAMGWAELDVGKTESRVWLMDRGLRHSTVSSFPHPSRGNTYTSSGEVGDYGHCMAGMGATGRGVGLDWRWMGLDGGPF